MRWVVAIVSLLIAAEAMALNCVDLEAPIPLTRLKHIEGFDFSSVGGVSSKEYHSRISYLGSYGSMETGSYDVFRIRVSQKAPLVEHLPTLYHPPLWKAALARPGWFAQLNISATISEFNLPQNPTLNQSLSSLPEKYRPVFSFEAMGSDRQAFMPVEFVEKLKDGKILISRSGSYLGHDVFAEHLLGYILFPRLFAQRAMALARAAWNVHLKAERSRDPAMQWWADLLLTDVTRALDDLSATSGQIVKAGSNNQGTQNAFGSYLSWQLVKGDRKILTAAEDYESILYQSFVILPESYAHHLFRMEEFFNNSLGAGDFSEAESRRARENVFKMFANNMKKIGLKDMEHSEWTQMSKDYKARHLWFIKSP